jgi:hypothetical protein
VVDQCACECRYGNDIKLESKKWLGTNKQTNKQKETNKGKQNAENATNTNVNSDAGL